MIAVDKLERLKEETEREMINILRFWMNHVIDESQGGFYGKIDNDNRPDTQSPKGLVLNARILWAFSAAYIHLGEAAYLPVASRAFQYLLQHFHDKEHGGYYWSVDHMGNRLDDKKQVYGIAFCIYAFAEYFKATNNQQALELAKESYWLIEQHSFDCTRTGYLEAFTRNWQTIDDLRLSTKDANEKKTMNTHLHVLEAYANLYTVWQAGELKTSIQSLLENFRDHIIDQETGHLHLFFNEDWQVKGNMLSYGHDVEAAWLLLEAAKHTGDEQLVDTFKDLSVKMATAAAKGLDIDGGLWYEVENGKLVGQKHSWPQAEALVGFYNAWQLTGERKYLQYVLNNWQFIQQYIIDKENGEWFWGINRDHTVMEGKDKAGFWKCPYHNTRACIEISKRISSTN